MIGFAVLQPDLLHLAPGDGVAVLGVDIVLHEILEARLPAGRTCSQLLVFSIVHCVRCLKRDKLLSMVVVLRLGRFFNIQQALQKPQSSASVKLRLTHPLSYFSSKVYSKTGDDVKRDAAQVHIIL